MYIIYNNLKKYKTKIIVKKSIYGGKLGRGVFASDFIKKGELLDEGFIIYDQNYDSLYCGIYKEYVYTRTDNNGICLPLGTVLLINHSSKNSNVFLITKNDKYYVFSKRNIYKDEEILMCYGCNHPNKDLHHIRKFTTIN